MEDPPITTNEAIPNATDAEVIALAKTAIKNSREELQQLPSSELQPGITIDLASKNIHHLPEEVIDVIKDEIER